MTRYGRHYDLPDLGKVRGQKLMIADPVDAMGRPVTSMFNVKRQRQHQ
jgi:hypothetical protein